VKLKLTESITLTPAQTRFLEHAHAGFDSLEWSVTSAGAAGSDRRFLRVQKKDDQNISYVLILWDSRDEDWLRFLSIEKDIGKTIPFLPKIFASDAKHGLILEEDLGNATLKRVCAEFPHKIETFYKSAIDALIGWQAIEPNASSVISSRAMDHEVFLWESRYFAQHCVTEYFGLDQMLDAAWEKERERIALAASALPLVCIHRDFQSENILLHDDRVRFVDFQGARLGPAGYDLASLLFDPYIPELQGDIHERLFKYYCLKSAAAIHPESFYLCAAQRLMQACGAYGNLSLHKGKEQYRRFIPVAIDRLAAISGKLPQYPRLHEIINKCNDIVTKAFYQGKE
jgi:aminoglycoside/choline kinase family phosphotransferase